MGQGLGHVSRLLRLAEKLRIQENRCIFLVSDLSHAGAKVQQSGFDVIAAPTVGMSPLKPGQQIASMADILMRKGYSDGAKLTNVLSAWKTIFKLTNPDLVVLEYSPTARLAVGKQFKTLLLGTGFSIPASISGKIAKFRKRKSLISEEKILETIAEVQNTYGDWVPERLIDLFRGDRVFIDTIPELDFFSSCRKTKITHPLFFPDKPVTDKPVNDIFCYLNGRNPKIFNLIKELQNLGVKGSAYLTEIDPAKAKSLTTESFQIYGEPQDIKIIARSTKFIIHNGGLGLSQIALGLGRPQILLPTHLEQSMNATNLVRLGSAKVVHNWVRVETKILSKEIYGHIKNATLSKSAYDVAKKLTKIRKPSLEFVLSECIKLMDSKD